MQVWLRASQAWLFLPTGSWAIWSVLSTNANLIAGTNKIKLIAIGSSGPNRDRLGFSCDTSAQSGQGSVSAKSLLPKQSEVMSLNVNPNPVTHTLNISTEGLKANIKSTVSVLSVSGVVIKTIQSNTLNKIVQLDVSSLGAGVYYIKVINGNKILYKQFVKL